MKTKFTIANIKNTFLRRLVTVLILPVIALLVLVALIINVLWDALTETAYSIRNHGPDARRFVVLAAVHNWLGSDAIKARNEEERKNYVNRLLSRRQA